MLFKSDDYHTTQPKLECYMFIFQYLRDIITLNHCKRKRTKESAESKNLWLKKKIL